MSDNSPYSVLDGDRPDASIVINLHDGTEEQVSIIVIHKDRPELLNICLQSIAVCSVNNNYEIIVVDNGSTRQDAVDYLNILEKEPDIKVIRNNKNYWWAAAANQGARAADVNSKYLIFMHYDVCILNPSWIDLLINISEAQNSGCIGLETAQYEIDRRKIGCVQEWCVLVSKECWKDCGPWIEELPQLGAPLLMTYRMHKKGYSPQVIDNKNNPVAWHYKAFSLDYNVYEKLSEESKFKLPKLLMELQKE